MHKCKVTTIGSDEDGNIIFCLFKINGQTICKGIFNFIGEKFHVIKWNVNTITEKLNISIEDAINALEETLLLDYDWELATRDKRRFTNLKQNTHNVKS